MTDTTKEPVPVQDREPREEDALQMISGLPPEEVRNRLRETSRATDLGHRLLSFYLWEMQERRLFQLTGHASAVHYGTTRLGMSRRRARELVAAGRMLEELEELDEAFRRGDLSWSKVRLLTEVTVAETQGAWIERASELGCRELEHEVRTTERGQPPRKDRRKGLPAVRFRVRAVLDALGQGKWEKARKKMQEETGRAVTDGELLVRLAEAFLAGGEGSGRSDYQVVVQQCPECEGALVETEEGPVPLEHDKASMVACDGERVGLSGPVDQPTPAWLRRAVLARDGRRCRSCRSTRGLMVHHVRFRSEGGPSRAENLVTLCARCHSLVHEGLLHIEGTNPSELLFVGGGREVSGSDLCRGTFLEILRLGARAPREAEDLPQVVDSAWWRAHEGQLEWKPRKGRFALRSEEETAPA